MSQSKELADQLNTQLGNITNEIKVAEQQSVSLQQQVQSLNLELSNEIANKSQLETNIRDLSNQLSAIKMFYLKKRQNLISLKTQI